MTTTIAKRQNGAPSVSFGNVVDNFFQNNLRRFFDDNFWDSDNGLNKGNVPVNVRDTGQHYELDVVAPGCRKEDFKVSIENNVLTVSFEQKQEDHQQDKDAGWVRNEYIQRSFSRSFTLDDTVDVEKVNATYNDGILKLTLGKNEKAIARSKTIEIK
ncbi:Hsp20/alpha crystallin family protein [Terrimonas rubra]|uniref:Hsp20/alpha crystallin family protein n=1 Tax=Terrimonas rubra TaxID=1035890 RepID=A0ABW6A5D4_9BACT